MRISREQIMDFKPYFHPDTIGMPDGYEASVPEFIKEYSHKIGSIDTSWILLRPEFMSDKDLRLYAVWCARQQQHLIRDERFIKLLDVSERHVYGLATDEELRNASADAGVRWGVGVVRPSVRGVAWPAAYAAYIASKDADAAARAAARAAALTVDSYDAGDADYAGKDTVRIVLDSQVDKLLDYFKTIESGQEYNWN